MNQNYEKALMKSRETFTTALEIISEELDNTFKWVFKQAYSLGKQEKDIEIALNKWQDISLKPANTEETVIQGWVARDKKYNTLNLYGEKPYRTKSGYQEGDEPDWWENDCASFMPIDDNFFPDITWDSEPLEVEIIIKRKKK